MESNDKKQVKTIKKVYPQIYSYELADMHDHDGWQKVGYTERKDVDERIREQTQTAAFKLNYRKLWSASSVFVSDHTKFFTDKDLHKYYVKNNITRSRKQDDGGFGEEWFYFDGTPEKSKELFDEYSNRDFSRQTIGKTPYILRDEQEKAVSQTLAYASENQTTDFDSPNDKAKFLWNAKPRFGKTLSSYDFAKRFNAKNVLIVTNRPAIANSWYDDFEKFIDGYYFISTTDSLKERPSLSRDEFLHRANPSDSDRQITFLSLQDLKGGKIFGGGYDKLEWVAGLNWDLLIVDEAHEGVDTERTDEAFKQIKRRFTLHLSGTPFKAIADGYFTDKQIFNWTYIDEQKAKKSELDSGNDAGDHVNLPDMRLFTYKMSDMIEAQLAEGMELDDENIDYAFELNDMFSTDQNGRFIHEREILTFLDQLTYNTKYPFSTPEMRDELKHTFWLVGNRVASAKAMEKLLRNHPVFGHGNYEIVLAAGDGKPNSDDDTSEEEMQNIAANEKAYDRVKRAIRNNERTITLSVGQLTTGVTIEEWSAVLMLSDIKSESLYMQAIFRSQNPYKYTDEVGDTYRKKSAYVFDFSPNRVLKVYDKFANNLLAKAAQGEITEKEREANVAELLNYFPVLAEDKDGEMIELNAEQVLTFPKAIIAKEVVKRGFVTNLLFVNINNVFNIPTEVIDSLNKTYSTNDTGRTQVRTEEVEHDPKRAEKRDKRISVNKERLLGNKVYGSKMHEIVEEVVNEASTKDEVVDKIVENYMHQAEEPFAAYREIYSPSNAELDELKNQHIEKVKAIAEEFVSQDISSAASQNILADKLSDLVETELPNDLVVHKEVETYENEEESEMDQIRKKLRTFTRAIPSFVMACKDVNAITLDNIEDTVSDEDFEQLFTEKDGQPFTKDDFRKIRGPYVSPETGQKFEGFFDKYTFNAAIREFEEKRQELADYLRPGIKEDIFSYIRPLKTNQIFTPRRVVNRMLDALEEQNPGIFDNPNLTFVDPYVKSGLYLTEIAKRLNRGLEDQIPDRDQRIKHIFEVQLHGYAPTRIIYDIAHKYIYGNFKNINDNNLKYLDLSDKFKKGEDLGMKFDVVVGNPPYQGDNHQQIYPDFYLGSRKAGNNVCLIFPTGWQEPKNANNLSKLNQKEIKEDRQIVFIDNRHNVFQGIPGAEWTNIILWQRGYDNGLNGLQRVLTDGGNPEERKLLYSKDQIVKPSEVVNLAKIVEKSPDFRSIATITSTRRPYGLTTDVIKDYESYGLFSSRKMDTDIKIYAKAGMVIYAPSNYEFSRLSSALNKYKVFIPYAWGNMSENSGLGGAFADIIVAKPNEACTETYLESGCFDDIEMAKKHAKYLMTRFARGLLYMNKTSQHSTTSWGAIPIQDYSENWWSGDIDSIDNALFEKYNIPDETKKFILDSFQRKTTANIVNYADEV